jgi:peptidoglycan/LPS O-acetylase OafA/YrhL
VIISKNIISRIDKFFLADGRRIGPLDGIRAIAITLVVVRHCFDRPLALADLPQWLGCILGFGWVGVSLFFCLSGFLIGGMIYGKLESQRFSFAEFYINRAFRILPIAYAMYIYTSRRLIGFNRDTLINFTFMTNIFKSHHFQGHFWSLCVEEQFYLLFPALFTLSYIFFRKNSRALFSLLFSLVILEWAFRAYSVGQPSTDIAEVYFQSQYQIDFLLFGVIGAVLYHDKSGMLSGIQTALLKISRWFIPLAPLLFIGLAFFVGPLNKVSPDYNGVSYAVGYPLIALFCFFMVYGLAVHQTSWMGRALSTPLLRWIAAVSYSMYIMQFQVIDRVNGRITALVKSHPDHKYIITIATIFGVFTLIAGLSTGTFLVIERPFQMIKKRIKFNKGSLNQRKIVAPLISQSPINP